MWSKDKWYKCLSCKEEGRIWEREDLIHMLNAFDIDFDEDASKDACIVLLSNYFGKNPFRNEYKTNNDPDSDDD